MGRRKKYEEGTADAFRKKKQLSKITLEDANAIMHELDSSYQEYKLKWDEAKTQEIKQQIENEYLSENAEDIERIKYVCESYWELIPGLRSILDDVYFNMRYTQMQNKWELMGKKQIKRKSK